MPKAKKYITARRARVAKARKVKRKLAPAVPPATPPNCSSSSSSTPSSSSTRKSLIFSDEIKPKGYGHTNKKENEDQETAKRVGICGGIILSGR